MTKKLMPVAISDKFSPTFEKFKTMTAKRKETVSGAIRDLITKEVTTGNVATTKGYKFRVINGNKKVKKILKEKGIIAVVPLNDKTTLIVQQ